MKKSIQWGALSSEKHCILVNSGAISHTFDANGNLAISTTGAAITTNTWSAENRLLSQVSPTVNEQYQYSQDGLRKEKTNASGTTLYTLDGQNVLLETTSSGVLQARNTQNPNGYGGLVSQNRSAASSFYGFDSQQSTRILVSVGGTITDSLSFKAFGEELQTGSGTVNPFWFGGQVGYFRDLPGVMNVGQRKLVAANGVFLNRDLIGFAGGDVNLLRFVGNNPLVTVDPSGMACSNFKLTPACTFGSNVVHAEGTMKIAGDYFVGSVLNVYNVLCIKKVNGVNNSFLFQVGGLVELRVTFNCDTDGEAAKYRIWQTKEGQSERSTGVTLIPLQLDDVGWMHYITEKLGKRSSSSGASVACGSTQQNSYVLRAYDLPEDAVTIYVPFPGNLPIIEEMDYHDCLTKGAFNFANPQQQCDARFDWSNSRGVDADIPADRETGQNLRAWWASNCSRDTVPVDLDSCLFHAH